MDVIFSNSGTLFIFIGIILVFLLEHNNHFSSRKFIQDTSVYFNGLMEEDYKFLLNVRYGKEVDIEVLFNQRVRNALIVIVLMFFIFLNKLSFAYVILSLLIGFGMFKLPYVKLKNYYKANLHKINLMLPYYLKGLEILIQHYTVPVALARSINDAPSVFKPGLKKMIERINSGDSTVDPYMEFANTYPVRDSMRMMRLLYRLNLGSNQDKHEQIMMFSKTVSTLQNKAREQKYKARLEAMERRTMIMLFGTGGGVILILFLAMTLMMNL